MRRNSLWILGTMLEPAIGHEFEQVFGHWDIRDFGFGQRAWMQPSPKCP